MEVLVPLQRKRKPYCRNFTWAADRLQTSIDAPDGCAVEESYALLEDRADELFKCEKAIRDFWCQTVDLNEVTYQEEQDEALTYWIRMAKLKTRASKVINNFLDNSASEFEDTDELFVAVGEALQGISEKSKDIRNILCEKLPENTASNGPRKVLDAPIHLDSKVTPANDHEDLKYIWPQTREDNQNEDKTKLETAEATLQQKEAKTTPVLQTATASQVTSKKYRTSEAKEEEVVGDEMLGVLSVLESDTVKEDLFKREKKITTDSNSGPTDPILNSELTDIYAQLETEKAPSRALIILSHLEFTTTTQAWATNTFFGGWRVRLDLARALFKKPDLLLLGEPTKVIFWVANYYTTTLETKTVLRPHHQRLFEKMSKSRFGRIT